MDLNAQDDEDDHEDLSIGWQGQAPVRTWTDFWTACVTADERDAGFESMPLERRAWLREVYMGSVADQLKSGDIQRYRSFAKMMPARAFELVHSGLFRSTAVVKALRRFEDSDATEMLVLTGRAGCGKTAGVVWWAWRYHPSLWAPRFITGAEIRAMSKFGAERTRLLDAEALIIDDVGAEASAVDLDEIVDVFYRERRRLAITTNLTIDQFATQYGERVIDRLREAGTFLVIASPSMRKATRSS